MIQNREQRKKASLLKRWKITIAIVAVLVVALGITLLVLFNYVSNVIPFVDSADGSTYYVTKVNGIWVLQDKNGSTLKKESRFGLYVTDKGTLVEVDPDTGKCIVHAIPEASDGESTQADKVLIFKHIEFKKIRSIEVRNQLDSFTFYRYNITDMKVDDSSDFTLRGSPLLTVKEDAISALASDAGYPIAASRIDDPVRKNGTIDLAEYGLAPEKRIKTELDSEGNEIEVEYDYTPSYYILTSTDGERFKMIIGDRLLNGTGYYAQYIDISGETETPRDKLYVLAASVSATLLSESKNFIVPGLTYPVTQNDYFDVSEFTISEKTDSGSMKDIISFSYVDLEDRTGTIQGGRPYVFTGDMATSYMPNFDRINTCLTKLMDPDITDIAVLSPTYEERAKYGLMKLVTDAEGKPILDSKGFEQYVYDSKYQISFKRTAEETDENGNKKNVEFLQTIYVSEKNKDGNYYSYTTLKFLDKTDMSNITGITFDMICEVSATTFNFLSYDEFDWIYPKVLETGIIYTTNVTLKKPDYTLSFDVNNIKDEKDNATSIIATENGTPAIETFGMLKFKDKAGNTWKVSQAEVTVHGKDGKEKMPSGRLTGTDKIGQTVVYLEKPIQDENGNAIYVNLNDVRVVYANGAEKTYVRYHTMIFKKLYQKLQTLSIVDNYEISEEDEAKLLADPSKLLATISITNTDKETTTVNFYEITSRKAYITVNGEGGFYVSTNSVVDIFESAEKFMNCEDIYLEI